MSLLVAFLFSYVYVGELQAAKNDVPSEVASPPPTAPVPPPPTDDPTTEDLPDLGDLFGDEDPFGLPPEDDPFGGLLGPSEGFGLGTADLTCLMTELGDDPALEDYLDDPLASPENLDGEAFLRLFETFETCGLLPAIADEMVAQTPGLTEAQALCVLESMMDLPPEALDSILTAGNDATALDPETMALLFGAVIDCGLSGTA